MAAIPLGPGDFNRYVPDPDSESSVHDPENNPYSAPASADEDSGLSVGSAQRNLVLETIGTTLSMMAGAFVGLLFAGDGLGFVSFVILLSIMGAVVWLRRRRSVFGTLGICVTMVIVWWPFGLMLRELGRDLY